MEHENASIEEKRWKFEKTIGVSHILATLAIAGSVFLWAQKMDSRVLILENEQTHAKAATDRADRDMREAVTDLKSYLIRIETKLDRKKDK